MGRHTREKKQQMIDCDYGNNIHGNNIHDNSKDQKGDRNKEDMMMVKIGIIMMSLTKIIIMMITYQSINKYTSTIIQ